MRVRFTPAARNEYIEALEWYAQRAPGLDDRLRSEFRRLRENMIANPRAFPQVRPDVHKAKLRHFPYVVIYRIAGDVLQVAAFFHTSRDPRRWRGRT